MILINENHNFSYDTENLAEIFFPYEKIKMFSHMPQNETDDKIVYTGINGSTVTVTADLCGAKHSACVQMSPDADRKNTLSVLFTACFPRQRVILIPGAYFTACARLNFIIPLCVKVPKNTPKRS